MHASHTVIDRLNILHNIPLVCRCLTYDKFLHECFFKLFSLKYVFTSDHYAALSALCYIKWLLLCVDCCHVVGGMAYVMPMIELESRTYSPDHLSIIPFYR